MATSRRSHGYYRATTATAEKLSCFGGDATKASSDAEMAVTRPSTIKSKTTPKTTSQDLSCCSDCFCNYCDSCHKCYCSEPPAGPPDFVQRTLSLDRRHQHLRRPTTTNRFDSVASSFTYLGYNIIRDKKIFSFHTKNMKYLFQIQKQKKSIIFNYFEKIFSEKKNIFVVSKHHNNHIHCSGRHLA